MSTTDLALDAHVDTAQHEHGWVTDSRHPTSEGTVTYMRCAACGTRRVDLTRPQRIIPAPLSRPIPRSRP